MHSSTPVRRARPPRRAYGAIGRAVLSVFAVATLILAGAPSASAFWGGTGTAASGATTAALAPPTDVTVPATAVETVPISWTASAGSPSPDGYVVTRTDATDSTITGTACSTEAPDTSCTDTADPGSYFYVVTAVYRTWTRASDPSDTVVVTAEALRFAPTPPPTATVDGDPVEVSPSPVELGSAGSYSVLALVSVVSTGATSLSGDLGVSPGTSITGFPPGILAGSIHAGDTPAGAAGADLGDALDEASGRAPDSEITGDLGGLTLHTGVYHSTAPLALTGTLTLDARGDPDAVFIIQSDGAFTTGAASTVVLADGAQAANVFWVISGEVTTGESSSVSGSILARGGITLGESTALDGQALSLETVTLATGTLTGVSPGSPVPDAGADAEADSPAAPEASAAPEATAAPETPASGSPAPTPTQGDGATP